MSRRIILVAIASGLSTGSLIGLRPLMAADKDVKITIDNFTFTPPEITVPVGAVVTWVNHDDIPHSIVASDKKTFRSKALDTDDSYSFTFAAAGDFSYFCGLHPHMTGKVIVKP
ncbi:MAG TPA: cupredoxin family copper-binding protein [Afipia sp.]